MSDLWQRLKQRKLVQWALAYVAGAFALLQGIDIVAQQFGWPEAVQRGITLALVLGFFVTLLLAWYHGERGVQKFSGVELLLLALLLAIGGGLLWKFSGAMPTGSVASTSVSSAGNKTARAAQAGDVIGDKSIAVLPFTSMSAGEDNAYFADGLSEEIINSLSRVPDLQVAARTSSFAFRDSKDTVPQIAVKLRVATVLEGSVRRGGDKLRISAQLIRASDGFELWSDTYDRSSDDVIAIQEDVARQIALALKTATDPKALADMQRVGTRSVAAYDAYIKGLALRQRSGSTGDFSYDSKALAAFDQAIVLDPGFPEAYGQSVSIAANFLNAGNTKSSDISKMPFAERLDDFRRRLDEAIRRSRDSAQVNLFHAKQAKVDLHFADAFHLVQRYLLTHPDDSSALGDAAFLADILGESSRQHEYAEKLFGLTRSLDGTSQGMLNMLLVGDMPRAITMAREGATRFPDAVIVAYQSQRILLTAGRVKEAATQLARVLTSDMPEQQKALAQMRQACAEGRNQDALKIYDRSVRDGADFSIRWHGLLLLGRDDEATRVLAPYDRPGMLYILYDFLFYPKFDVSRYPALEAALKAQGIVPRPVKPEPYACKPQAAAS